MRFRRHATTSHRATTSKKQRAALRVVEGKKPATHSTARSLLTKKVVEARALVGSARMIAGLTLALVSTGIYMVSSASVMPSLQVSGTTWHYFEYHMFFLLVGTVLALSVSLVDYHRFLSPKLTAPLLGFSLVTLIYVKANGVSIGGARRWIPIFGTQFQPSEVAKLAVVLAISTSLAAMSSRRRGDRPKVVAASVIALPCAFFVVIEPDFGTASIIVAIGLAGLYAVGVSSATMLKSFATLIAAGTAYALANPYAVRRFTGLLHQGQELLSTNYQLHQSKIAVGSGALTGKGLGGSTLKFGALPNPHTDFIFSILGEEFGLVGTCVVVMLFGLLIWFGINAAMRAKDVQGTLIALSVTTWIGLQAIINISSTIGLFPVTGVPLPFISYGGTALIVDLIAIGLLINVAKGERPPRRAAAHGPKAKPRAQVAGQRNRPRRSPAMSGAARPAQGISRRSR